jgi:predicted nucleic acid-binding protein
MARAVRESPAAMPFALLLDTNVLLDVILDRAPWADDATALLDNIARHRARGYVAGHAVATVYYLVARAKGDRAATTAVSDLLEILDVVPLERADFQRALALGLKDYEDAVQAAASLKIGARFLVTRNERDFKGAPVVPRTPGEVLALLATGADK